MLLKQCIGFLNTPPLWKDKVNGVQQFNFPLIDLESFTPDPIPDNIRLGHQVEYIFKALIEYADEYNILVYNLPISQEKTTIGEIDFILEDRLSKQLIHVELTYKFYIIDPSVDQPRHRLIGPNNRDSFVAKLSKIKDRQFPLLHTEAGFQALLNIDIDPNAIIHQCGFKAQLFQPYGKSIAIGELNNDCVVGYWMRLPEFESQKFAEHQYYLPSKSEWLVEAHPQVDWISHETILDTIIQFHGRKYAPMIWIKKPNGELDKAFILWW